MKTKYNVKNRNLTKKVIFKGQYKQSKSHFWEL